MSVGIIVDTPQEICISRGLERDRSTGKSDAELTKLWEEWIAEEEAYFKRDNPKSYADVVVDGATPFEIR